MQNVIVLTALFMIGTWANCLSPAGAAPASDHTMDSAGDPVVRPGKQIRQINLKGYTLTYYLLDLSERGEMMKIMGHHTVIGMNKSSEVTNHLMVYIQKPDGKPVPGDVAYLLKGPDGRDFRTMTMGMHGGHGADITMNLKGIYTIGTKVILESREGVKFDDEFTFQVK